MGDQSFRCSKSGRTALLGHAWNLPYTDGHTVQLLIPGAELGLLRDDLTSAAPLLYVNGEAWWWNAAVGSVAGEGVELNQ